MAGTSSPESPRDGLRKRGRQPSFDLLDLGDSSPVATTSAGHRRTLTASSDGFGDFVDPPPASFDSSSHAADVGFDDDENDEQDEHWQDADMVQSFSPVQDRQTFQQSSNGHAAAPAAPAATSSSTTAFKGIGPAAAVSADLLDWDAWDTPTGPQSVTPGAGAAAAGGGGAKGAKQGNPADEDFFAAFERAAIARSQRQPSPPMIDLRDMEKQLADRKQKQRQAGQATKEDDFFATFEASPEETMRGNARRIAEEKSPGLTGTKLDDMKDAQDSPMQTARSSTMADYFGGASFSPSKGNDDNGIDEQGQMKQGRSDSWSEMAGSWGGSLRKTLGSLRGLPAGVANHLPSASDFIVPPEEGEEQQREASSSRQRTPSPFPPPKEEQASPLSMPTPRRKQSIASASDYSHGTPFGASTSPTSPTIKPVPPNLMAASTSSGHVHRTHYSTAPAAVVPISGAPGFDASATRRWNTGEWSLSSHEESLRSKRPMPVTLRGRREETNEVIEDWHAARLQPHLPPRLQLGKSWKLLYSSDQHGISLGTLYRSVESGMSASASGSGRGSRLSGGGGAGAGVAQGEGWLRGASGATKAALIGAGGAGGSSVKRLGGGLMSLADAGLIVAVRDADDNVFGAFVNERIRPQAHYYGNGECFLWKTTNLPSQAAAPDEDAGGRRQKISTFGYTGKNDYMALTEAHYLSFGGGEGKYGFWLDGSLDRGISATCPAFDNEVLCNPSSFSKDDGEDEGKFECICIEVWACGID